MQLEYTFILRDAFHRLICKCVTSFHKILNAQKMLLTTDCIIHSLGTWTTRKKGDVTSNTSSSLSNASWNSFSIRNERKILEVLQEKLLHDIRSFHYKTCVIKTVSWLWFVTETKSYPVWCKAMEP